MRDARSLPRITRGDATKLEIFSKNNNSDNNLAPEGNATNIREGSATRWPSMHQRSLPRSSTGRPSNWIVVRDGVERRAVGQGVAHKRWLTKSGFVKKHNEIADHVRVQDAEQDGRPSRPTSGSFSRSTASADHVRDPLQEAPQDG